MHKWNYIRLKLGRVYFRQAPVFTEIWLLAVVYSPSHSPGESLWWGLMPQCWDVASSAAREGRLVTEPVCSALQGLAEQGLGSSLAWWKVSVPMAEGLEQDELQCPSQPVLWFLPQRPIFEPFSVLSKSSCQLHICSLPWWWVDDGPPEPTAGLCIALPLLSRAAELHLFVIIQEKFIFYIYLI